MYTLKREERWVRLQQSLFPMEGMDVGGTALVVLEDPQSQLCHVLVLSSKSQAIDVSQRLTDTREQAILIQAAGASNLPGTSTTELVELNPFTSIRVVVLLQEAHNLAAAHGGHMSKFRSKYPILLNFAPTNDAIRKEMPVDPEEALDFFSVAMNSAGQPEVTVGFSKHQAREYLEARQLWNVHDSDFRGWLKEIEKGDLPDHADQSPVIITGSAAAFIYEAALIQYATQPISN